MVILYTYFGVVTFLFLFFFVKEISFFVRSTFVEGEVLYSSIKTTYAGYEYDDEYSKPEKTVHAKVVFKNNEGKERISNINFIGKRELEIKEKIGIRYLTINPDIAKLSKIRALFYWSVFFAIILLVSIIILLVIWWNISSRSIYE